MFFRSLSAERVKLTTTASVYWITAIFFIVTVGLAALIGVGTKQAATQGNAAEDIQFTAEFALGGMELGKIIIVILAVLMVTSEYTQRISQVTFAATPQRTTVALSKLLLGAVWAAVITLIASMASIFVFRSITDTHIDPFGDADVRFLIGFHVLSAVLTVWFAMSIAWLVRRTAGAISLSIIWMLVLEKLVGVIPRFGVKIQRYLPFQNLEAFHQRTDVPDVPWEWHGSLAYFILWVLVLFVAGMVLLNRRDA